MMLLMILILYGVFKKAEYAKKLKIIFEKY